MSQESKFVPSIPFPSGIWPDTLPCQIVGGSISGTLCVVTIPTKMSSDITTNTIDCESATCEFGSTTVAPSPPISLTTTSVTINTVDCESATCEVGSTVVATATQITPAKSSYIASNTSSPSGRSTVTRSTTSPAIPAVTGPASPHENTGPNAGQIVGIVLGSVIGGCLLIFLTFLFFCWKRRSKRRSEDGAYREEKPFSRASMRRSFRMIGTSRPSQFGGEESQSMVPNSSDRPETRNAGSLAVNPTPFRKPIRVRSKKKAVLPISAPVLTNRPSIQEGFRERFFSEPPDLTRSPEVANQHLSNVTTIRTSANPSTPISPPLTVLSTYSAAPSQPTSFEEDKDHQSEAMRSASVPNVADALAKLSGTDGEQSGPARHSIEAGIKRSISRAMAHVPTTSKHGDVDNSTASRSTTTHPPSAFKGRHSTKPHIARSLKPGEAPTGSASEGQVEILGSKGQTAPPYLEIPGRDSSLGDFGAEARRELHLQSRSQLTLQSDGQGVLRPPPLALRKHSKRSHSSIRTYTSPTVSKSASLETLRSLTRPPASSHLRRSRTRHEKVSVEDIARYANRPLPTVGKSDTASGSNSGSTLAVRETTAPFRLRLPSINQEPLQIFAPANYAPPEAIFTPDRTSTGELVLRVDL